MRTTCEGQDLYKDDGDHVDYGDTTMLPTTLTMV